jgi:hypothetical protein
MAQYVFWPANQNHPIWRGLSFSAKGLFLDMAGHIADGEREDLPDGMFLSIWLPQLNSPKAELEPLLHELTEASVLMRVDDPEGWQIKNWTERVRSVRATSLEAIEIRWGQKSAQKYFERRKAENERKQSGALTPMG